MYFTVVTKNSLDESKLTTTIFNLDGEWQIDWAIRLTGKEPSEAIIIPGRHYPIIPATRANNDNTQSTLMYP